MINVHIDQLQSDLLDLPVHLHYILYPKLKLYESMKLAVMAFVAVPMFIAMMGGTVLTWNSKQYMGVIGEQGAFLVMSIYYFLLFLPSERTNSTIFQYIIRGQIIEFWRPNIYTHPPRRDEEEERDQDGIDEAREDLVNGEEEREEVERGEEEEREE
eukprot:CAMPEP_0201543198 /NCGR_PEP_ID=MMETSP0161_2-20130828/72463_1 /ASSEMBLY_ACC=CAM_ASM_000251 /TAXON_ID=180227 /ORGANISM="Neoparamoeba aestuarina, Strain SoJaBio B1-5/56/2" /LENGTH=156 /DNA_ID=CAMNT_0047950943 /DNA_START=577 /DNA_END=1044 /DNA_ORIENTATION=+